MAISAVSATLEASGCPTPGRMEKMTSLMTCEIRPCCASMAIFVLRVNEITKQPVYQWLACLSYSSLAGYPLVSFLPFPSAVIQSSEKGRKMPRKKITLPVPPSFSLGTGATAFVDTTAFSALTNFWCRSESCDTAYALFWQFHKQI